MANTLFHGARRQFEPGTQLRPDAEGYTYVTPSERWADAFAYRDAASRAVDAAATRATGAKLSGATPIALDSSISQVTGFIHTVKVSGPTKQDPDFRKCPASQRTSRTATVVSSTPGKVSGWRELTSIVGPYSYWIEKTPAFDPDGYLLPPPLWELWGYTKDDLRALGPWFPFGSVWENTRARSLILVSEFSIPFTKLGACRERDQILDELGARVPFTPETAEMARTTWWQ